MTSDPADAAAQAIANFRAGGYRNTWVHKSVRLKARPGSRAELRCDLDPSRFRLEIVVLEGATVRERATVMETLPDEIIFAHRFKTRRDEGNNVTVLHSSGEAVFRLPV